MQATTVSKIVRQEIQAQLQYGDRRTIVHRLRQKGVKISAETLSQFLTFKRPMKTIGKEVVSEARAIFAERQRFNKEALKSLQAAA